jgi:O-antigen ligase
MGVWSFKTVHAWTVQRIKRIHIMKCNVGTIDRTLRIAGGLILIVLAATGTVGVWGWIGVVPLLTGVFRFCPAYPLLGINSCPKEQAVQSSSKK